jgi:glycosyltransferase involved in cell wall biosynthesis
MAKKKRKTSFKSGSVLENAVKSGKIKASAGKSDGSVVVSQNKEKKRILIWGASPYVITGFGIVVRKVLQGLYNMYPGEYEIYQVGINHMGDHYEEAEITGGPKNGTFRQWPAMYMGAGKEHMYGQRKFLELMPKILSTVDIDMIFLMEDPFWVGGPVPNANPPIAYIDAIKNTLKALNKTYIPIVSYFPIDGVPKKSWIDNIAKIDFPVTYLKFGAVECIQKNTSLNGRLRIIPHGVDPEEFFPISREEARTFKRAMFGEEFADKFMFLNVNRNQLRKFLPSNLLAFKHFQKKVPESFIYMNMKAHDVGWNLPEVCNMLGLVEGKDVLFPPQFNVQKGLTLEDLNKVFNAADVFVSTAVGGGWELSITQAFATKTTVIAPQNTSHTELCGEGENKRGLLYRSGANLSQIAVFPGDNEVPRPLPDTDDLLQKMLWAYENQDECRKIEDRAYEWTQTDLNWDKNVVPKFHEVFSTAKKRKNDNIQVMHQQAALRGLPKTGVTLKEEKTTNNQSNTKVGSIE